MSDLDRTAAPSGAALLPLTTAAPTATGRVPCYTVAGTRVHTGRAMGAIGQKGGLEKEDLATTKRLVSALPGGARW